MINKTNMINKVKTVFMWSNIEGIMLGGTIIVVYLMLVIIRLIMKLPASEIFNNTLFNATVIFSILVVAVSIIGYCGIFIDNRTGNKLLILYTVLILIGVVIQIYVLTVLFRSQNVSVKDHPDDSPIYNLGRLTIKNGRIKPIGSDTKNASELNIKYSKKEWNYIKEKCNKTHRHTRFVCVLLHFAPDENAISDESKKTINTKYIDLLKPILGPLSEGALNAGKNVAFLAVFIIIIIVQLVYASTAIYIIITRRFDGAPEK